MYPLSIKQAFRCAGGELFLKSYGGWVFRCGELLKDQVHIRHKKTHTHRKNMLVSLSETVGGVGWCAGGAARAGVCVSVFSVGDAGRSNAGYQ